MHWFMCKYIHVVLSNRCSCTTNSNRCSMEKEKWTVECFMEIHNRDQTERVQFVNDDCTHTCTEVWFIKYIEDCRASKYNRK